MLYYEWRRIFRQRLRNFQLSKLKGKTYAQASRFRIIGIFLLFCAGWNMAGTHLQYKYFYRYDERIQDYRLHTPGEVREMIREKRNKINPYEQLLGLKVPDRPQIEISKTTFDMDA